MSSKPLTDDVPNMDDYIVTNSDNDKSNVVHLLASSHSFSIETITSTLSRNQDGQIIDFRQLMTYMLLQISLLFRSVYDMSNTPRILINQLWEEHIQLANLINTELPEKQAKLKTEFADVKSEQDEIRNRLEDLKERLQKIEQMKKKREQRIERGSEN
mmetsp:Transcript_30025/g.36556  ORF Transcript_30025/g.36556 Transcript_30025/m.36556 type:complete len:158 (+) Transcript_30025:131-604(+)